MQNTDPSISRIHQLLRIHGVDLDAAPKVGRFTSDYIRAVLAGERQASPHTLQQIAFAIASVTRQEEQSRRRSAAEDLDTELLGCAVAKSLWEYEPEGDEDPEQHMLLVLSAEISDRTDLTDKQKIHALALTVNYLTSTLNGRYRQRDGFLFEISEEQSLALLG